MSNVTASMVKELRDRTGVGMGKCKEALDKANGDIEEAINILRKAGMASAVKKESRETNEGMVNFVEDDHSIAIVEINAETDFVVQNERFQEFAKMVAEELLKHQSTDLDQFLTCQTSSGMTVDECRAEQIQSLGENLRIRRIELIKKPANHSFGVYSHMGGKILSLVEIAGSDQEQELARGIAMHVAAEFPEYLSPEEVPADIKAREDDIARNQVQNKPANIQDKIVEGKLNAFFDQVCLIRQKYVRDPSMTIEQVIAAKGKQEGKALTLHRFLRWQIGA
ncbi:MAG: translation elongation factor Ts [Simkaniaceae bacterium]|nr:translation elongation factor Ts [Simkaniaceae bacterium]MCF7852417.1 translation elongation factor Ts [Simkaniaceae bacterium]